MQCPPETAIGSVKLHWNNLVTHLSVLNASQEVVLLILGPSLQTSIFGNSNFEVAQAEGGGGVAVIDLPVLGVGDPCVSPQVKSRDEQHVVGFMRMESGNFVLSFPLDLEVSLKAVLLGAVMYLVSVPIALCTVMAKNIGKSLRNVS